MTSTTVSTGTLAFQRAFLLAVIAISVSVRPALAQEAEEAVFVGYNLKNYLNMDRRVDGESVKNAPKPEREIAALVTMIQKSKPDVLGLVEIGSMEDVTDLQTRLKAVGLDLPHKTINRAFDEDRRVAVLSKFPIAATNHQTSLTYLLDEKRMLFKRGILDATVQINKDYQLRVLGTHLKSKREIQEADQALMRRNEAHLMREYVNKILTESPKANLLLFGDYNDSRNEAPIKALQGKFGSEAYLKDIKLADDLGYTWTYCWSYADQYSRFDYIFANKALLPEIDTARSHIVADPVWFTASDHRPTVVTVKAKD